MSSKIKRYHWNGDESRGGEIVLHSDHEAEVARLRAMAQEQGVKDGNEITRLRAEVEHLTEALRCRTIDWNEACNSRESWTEKAKATRAEADALRLDAERYRWLRNDAMTGTKHDPAVLKDGPTDCCDFMFGDELDAAIDAAMGASE